MHGRFLYNTFHTLSTTALITAANIAFSIILTRRLGPEGKGAYTVAFRSIGILLALAQWGIPEVMLYYMRKDLRNAESIAANNAVFIPVVSCLAALVLWLFFPFLEKSIFKGVSQNLLWIAFLITPFNLGFLFFNRMIQLDGRIRISNYLNLGLSCAMLVTIVLALRLPFDKTAAAISAQVLSEFLVCIAAVILVRKQVAPGKWTFDRHLLFRNLAAGNKVQLGMASALLGQHLAMFILNIYLDLQTVGFYATASGLAGFLLLFSTSIRSVLQSWMPSGDSQRDVLERTIMVFRHTMIILIMGIVYLIFLGRPLIIIMYGKAFEPAFAPLIFLLPSVLFQGQAQILASYLAYERRLGIPSIAAGISVAASLSSSIILIPIFKASGAAVSTSLGQLSSMSFMLAIIITSRKRKLVEFFPSLKGTKIYRLIISQKLRV